MNALHFSHSIRLHTDTKVKIVQLLKFSVFDSSGASVECIQCSMFLFKNRMQSGIFVGKSTEFPPFPSPCGRKQTKNVDRIITMDFSNVFVSFKWCSFNSTIFGYSFNYFFFFLSLSFFERTLCRFYGLEIGFH